MDRLRSRLSAPGCLIILSCCAALPLRAEVQSLARSPVGITAGPWNGAHGVDIHPSLSRTVGPLRSTVGILPVGSGQTAPAAVDSSRMRVFRWMLRDLGALGKKAVSPKVLLASGIALAGTFSLAWLGDDIYHQARLAYRGTFRDVLEVVDYLGGPMINYPVLAVAGGSLLTKNVKLQDAAWTSLQTLVYAGVLGYTLKAIFGRERPEWSDDPYDFFKRTGMIPFLPEGNSSFPSGHAIAAFGIITPWVLYYPSIITYGLYVLPVGTGISRVALGKHWATDILVGSVIGISMGTWLTRRHQRAQGGSRPLKITFMEEGRLFSVVWHLP